MTKMDEAIEKVEGQLIQQAAEQKRMKPFLDKQLRVIEKLDSSILYFEKRIEEAEKQKQLELRAMNDLLELAQTSSHKLRNGYEVRPDNKHYIKIEDVTLFMQWLKINKTPSEVFKFFESAIGKTALKKFVNKEINQQRLNGELTPSIAGIDLGEITYRRLTTKKGKKK